VINPTTRKTSRDLPHTEVGEIVQRSEWSLPKNSWYGSGAKKKRNI